MKNTFFSIGIILFLLAICFFTYREFEKLKEERDLYKSNTSVLMQDNYKYKVSDSLNASSVSALRLSMSELIKYKKSEYDLIKNLNIKGRNVESVVSASSATESKINAIAKDSVNKSDTLRCFDVKTKWYDFSGCYKEDKFSGLIVNRDSLVVVESVKLKRFLGFLWKTKKVKARKIDIVSKNPNTKILGLEFIKIID